MRRPRGAGDLPEPDRAREPLDLDVPGRPESPKDVEERTFEAFPRLKERRRQMAGTLSGGEQQMLAISRALVTGRASSCSTNCPWVWPR